MNLPQHSVQLCVEDSQSFRDRCNRLNRTTARNLFVERPYVRCIQCTETSRIKCEDCLRRIVLGLKCIGLKEQQEKKRLRKLAERKRLVPDSRQIYQVSNYFSLFMEKKMSRPQLDSDRFTKPMRYAISPIREAKFETWTKKSFDRVKHSLLERLRLSSPDPRSRD